MIRFLFLPLALLGVLCGGLNAANQPNIIFILSDDLAQGDIGCYGQKIIQTPNLDRMAGGGVRYLQAYCGTSVCAPSRASLMTGLHSGHCPIRANREIEPEGQMPLPEQTVTIAQVLKGAGYATACMGKWGMGMFDTTGSPLKKGFDHFFGYNCQRHAHSYFPAYLYRNDQRFDLPGNDGKGIGKTYAQNLIQEDVLKWIRTQKDRPFFLFYAITLPHAKHEIDNLGIYADKPWTQQQKAYASQVTRLDQDVGQVLALLKELGLDDNTLVIVSGDNGSSFAPNSEIGKLFDQAGNGLRGYKRGLYEGALRQAAIARWPGVIPAGQVREEPWAFWDFFPTAAELAGAKIPAGSHTDGFSLVGFLKGGLAPKRDYFYWELHEGKPLQAVRFEDWKAVRNGPQAEVELYDLAADPGEKSNLAKQKPELVARAAGLMKAAHTPDKNWPLKLPSDSPGQSPKAEPRKPTSHTSRQIEGWSVRIDDRLLAPTDDALGQRALRFLEGKLADINAVVPAEPLAKLHDVAIVMDLSHGKLGPMQYHPSAGWLNANGYATNLARCVHIPRAADLPTPRNITEQPWVVLHELAHAYHDQVLGFDDPRILKAYEDFKHSGHGDRALLYDGSHVRHYGLTDPKEFFAEMTESYFGVDDFFPFNRAELMTAEPEIHELMRTIWGPVAGNVAKSATGASGTKPASTTN